MSDIEVVETLTGIMERQAFLIRELHSLITRLNVITAYEAEIEAAQKDVDEILNYGKY